MWNKINLQTVQNSPSEVSKQYRQKAINKLQITKIIMKINSMVIKN